MGNAANVDASQPPIQLFPTVMQRPLLPLYLLAPLCLFFFWGTAAPAQIAGTLDSTETRYVSKGMTDQPFIVEVLDARRTVSNSLLVRLALTNHGTAPLRAGAEFSGNDNPVDAGKISALYAVDPNGQTKYIVLRGTHGQPLCSRVVPDLQPGERRTVYAQLSSPPDTSSSITIVFPHADPILHVPIGLPEAGEPIPPDADFGNPGVPSTTAPVPIAPSSAIDQPTSNNLPNVYTNQTQIVGSGAPLKGIGSVESANASVPFTVEVLGLKATPAGATLRLAFTNNGSGNLDATGQFTSGIADAGDPRQISGVYLIDAASQQRFQVVRGSETSAQCSKIDPALGPGERRTLEAQFPAIPSGVKSVYVYFPHTTPISSVPVTR